LTGIHSLTMSHLKGARFTMRRMCSSLSSTTASVNYIGEECRTHKVEGNV
jgi:hypothetical protein